MTTEQGRLEQQLQKILAEIRVTSPEAFSFGGEEVKAPAAISQETPPKQTPPLVLRLQEYLYQRSYCASLPPPAAVQQLPSGNDEFVRELSQANTSVSRWDANWRVTLAESTGRIWAEKGGMVRVFQPGEFVSFSDPGLPIRVGSTVSAYIARESTTVQPGLYFAFGETVAAADNLDLFRLYWNIDASGAVTLLRLVTRDLNRYQVPFQIKSSIWPEGYQRRDAAVLYVKKRFYRLVITLAETWARECFSSLRDEVPLFTLPVGPGLGVAEDPETGESFGMNRCRHVAEALWNAHLRGLPSEEYLRAVKEQFKQQNLDFQRPYLNPGSVDVYAPGARKN